MINVTRSTMPELDEYMDEIKGMGNSSFMQKNTTLATLLIAWAVEIVLAQALFMVSEKDLIVRGQLNLQ